jgi:hypothetical protein
MGTTRVSSSESEGLLTSTFELRNRAKSCKIEITLNIYRVNKFALISHSQRGKSLPLLLGQLEEADKF